MQLKQDPVIFTFHQPTTPEHSKFDMLNDVLKNFTKKMTEK